MNQDFVIESYRESFRRFGDSPEALQWSPDGQHWRFEKLLEIASVGAGQGLTGQRILEVGCGLGHLYPLLRERFGEIDYTGIDIVPEMIDYAQAAWPGATFECRDLFRQPLTKDYDFVFISGIFNAPFRKDSREFMSGMLKASFAACRVALTFNFTSPDTNYFDSAWVLDFVSTQISPKLQMHQHYRNCDVAVCVCR